MKARTLNLIHDYRPSSARLRHDDDDYAIMVLCSACAPNHPRVDVVDDQVEDDECDRCGIPGLCDGRGYLAAIKHCACSLCGID